MNHWVLRMKFNEKKCWKKICLILICFNQCELKISFEVDLRCDGRLQPVTMRGTFGNGSIVLLYKHAGFIWSLN